MSGAPPPPSPSGDNPTLEALRNWHPRMLANGVDYNDAEETLKRVESWDDWCRAWCATAAIHEDLAREAFERGRRRTAAEAFLSASVTYHFAQFVWDEDLGQKQSAQDKKVETFREALGLLDEPIEWVEAPFEDTILPGFLRKPRGADRPPVVLIIAGLDSTKEEFYSLGGDFLARGMAVLAFDGPGHASARSTPTSKCARITSRPSRARALMATSPRRSCPAATWTAPRAHRRLPAGSAPAATTPPGRIGLRRPDPGMRRRGRLPPHGQLLGQHAPADPKGLPARLGGEGPGRGPRALQMAITLKGVAAKGYLSPPQSLHGALDRIVPRLPG